MNKIVSHCGFCGSPLDASNVQVWPTPENYKPEDYPASACIPCANYEDEYQNNIDEAYWARRMTDDEDL